MRGWGGGGGGTEAVVVVVLLAVGFGGLVFELGFEGFPGVFEAADDMVEKELVKKLTMER
jgi:hypothetical protein